MCGEGTISYDFTGIFLPLLARHERGESWREGFFKQRQAPPLPSPLLHCAEERESFEAEPLAFLCFPARHNATREEFCPALSPHVGTSFSLDYA
jgi:hypothetical protein